MVDQCCGMANEGCCMAGQQCYTYYENVCENVNEARCQPNIKQICVDVVLPDCRIVKERRQQVRISVLLVSLSSNEFFLPSPCPARFANPPARPSALSGRGRSVT